jgi:nucleoside diphosphate kinase
LSGINGEDFGDRKIDEDIELAGGLQVVSVRMIYATDEQLGKYKEAIGSGDNLVTQIISEGKEQFVDSGTPYLALVVRGPGASIKVEQIIGGSNPEIGRNMRERSMRAFYGKDK